MEQEKENLKIQRKETGKYIEFRNLPEAKQYRISLQVYTYLFF